MRQQASKTVWKRKFIHATGSKHDLPLAANVLNREFNPSATTLAYFSDIIYIRTCADWLYLNCWPATASSAACSMQHAACSRNGNC